MSLELNTRMRTFIENGSYTTKNYYQSIESLQSYMGFVDYHYYVTTSNNMFNFITRYETFEIPLNHFDWKMLWDKLGDIPINDNDEIENRFEHFDLGSDISDIWDWFEWFFDISLGVELYS